MSLIYSIKELAKILYRGSNRGSTSLFILGADLWRLSFIQSKSHLFRW